MELKRSFVRQMTGQQKCLNCTVMELKQLKTFNLYYYGKVLIVPLWN